jgi:hypothetical protein
MQRNRAGVLTTNVRAGVSCRDAVWSAPSVAFLDSNSGACTALSCEECSGEAGAPSQMGVKSVGEHDMVRMV